MRTFIAVDVPDEVKEQIGEYIQSIKTTMDKNIKWVNPKNLHFTIKFLGEIRKSELPALKDCVQRTAAEFDRFLIELSGLGVFPNENNPRVFWVGTDIGGDSMLDIFHDLENMLEKCGYDRDSKTFSPHLTIGRVKKYKKATMPERIIDFDHAGFEAKGLSIIKSTLTPDGPIYENIFSCPFEKDTAENTESTTENEEAVLDMADSNA